MVSPIPIAIGALSGVVGLLVLAGGAGRLRAWNRLRSADAGAVLGPGMVQVEGVAKPHRETLDPPRGDAESLAYDYEQEERRRDPDPDEHGYDWHTVDSEHKSVPFVVAAGTEEVLVDPEDADFLFEQSTQIRGDSRHKIARLDVDESVYVAGRAVRATEADVPSDGQRYAVTGGDSLVGGQLVALAGTPFVVADTGEDAAERRLLARGAGAVVLGAVLLGFAALPILVGLGG